MFVVTNDQVEMYYQKLLCNVVVMYYYDKYAISMSMSGLVILTVLTLQHFAIDYNKVL